MDFTFHRRPPQVLFPVIGLIFESILPLQESLSDATTQELLHRHSIAFRELEKLIQGNHHVILPRQFFLILSMSQYEILLTSPIANEGPSVFRSTTNLQLKGRTGKEHTTSITAVILRICQKDVLVRQYIPHLPLPIILTNFLSLLQTFLQKSPIISLCKGILGRQ